MQNVFAVLALLCSALPAAADVYKWVDREGKVHYGDTQPTNVPSRLVELPDIGAGSRPEAIPAPQEQPRDGPPPSQAAAAPQAPVAAVRGMPFDVYIMLRNGMTEGELLQRAGPPDYESNDGTVGSAVISGRRGRVRTFNNLELRKLYYYPTLSDPFTTIVTLTGGMISDLQRTRKF
jgi:hypothetical protein